MEKVTLPGFRPDGSTEEQTEFLTEPRTITREDKRSLIIEMGDEEAIKFFEYVIESIRRRQIKFTIE